MDNDKLLDKLADISVDQDIKTKRDCFGCSGWTPFNSKLHVYDWLHDYPEMQALSDMVEVQFKNTNKDFFLNSNKLDLKVGDVVAVEAFPGHDIGTVTLTGKLVEMQMRKKKYREDPVHGVKRVYRIARPSDIEKYEAAKERETPTMIRAREIAERLELSMKISDVEFQGDGSKAIFYYIADERVDFRQLIKEYAYEFRIKIEMRQIGARQEAALVGGVGPCGQELCCSRWMTKYVSVSTAATRYQDISFNPQKLAGLCGKLKCCMNFEVDAYVEASRKLPSREIVLHTEGSEYYHFKTDILSQTITYSTDKHMAVNLQTISRDRAFEIISMNRKGKKPELLNVEVDSGVTQEDTSYKDNILDDNSLTRFDNEQPTRRRRPRRNRRNRRPEGQQQQQQSERRAAGQNENNRNAHDKKDNERGDNQNENRRRSNQRRGNQRTNNQRNANQQGRQQRGDNQRNPQGGGNQPADGKRGGDKDAPSNANRNRTNRNRRNYRNNPRNNPRGERKGPANNENKKE